MSDQVFARRNVFLDTQVYVANNFDYSNRNFTRLASLVGENRISIYTTSITIDEIKANILDSIKESKKAVKDFQKSAKLLRKSRVVPFQIIWDRHDYEIILADLISQMNEYISSCDTDIIPIDGVSIQGVFSRYFSNQPPFKEGEKKHEFPDAFVIAALELWSLQKGQPLYIISGDNDWKESCGENPHFKWLLKLEALFELIEFDERLIAELSEDIFGQHLEGIEAEVKNQFEQLGFYIDISEFSRTTDDENVEKTTVDNVELVEKYLVSVNHETLLFTCVFNVNFQAEIHYMDFTNAAYDDEDGKFYFGESVDETIEYSELTTVEVEISFSRDEPVQSKLERATILVEDIRIKLEDDEKFPYK